MVLLLLLALVSSGFATMCNSAQWSDTDRRAFVKVHNELRSKIALGRYKTNTTTKPPAADMLKLVYDCELEALAQGWADTCNMSHSKNGNGENWYAQWWNTYPTNLTALDLGTVASKDWESEFINKEWVQNKFVREMSDIGHATQMAWSSTRKIGCGVTVCPNWISLYCQYSPQGNYLEEAIYTEGKTCSQCPEGTHCEKCTGLCK